MMNETIKILLADDHEIFRNGLKQLIDGEADMTVISEASDGQNAIKELEHLSPDVIIMDIRMPGINGIETAEAILKKQPQAKILFFSLYDNKEYIIKALQMGASGFVLKDTSNKIFLNAVRSVHNGMYYFIGEVTDVIIRQYINERNSSRPEPDYDDIILSKREDEILGLLENNKNNKEIAEYLNVSIRTVEAHRMNILRKFQANSIDDVLSKREKSKNA